MKTIQQLRDEYEKFAIPPLLSVDETALLFAEIDRLEEMVESLEARVFDAER